nr:MAG TPA: terminase large subunit [Caudoviricetes sp.]
MLFSPLYKPLFRAMPDTRYTLVKGGRGSGKSYAVNTALCLSTYRDPLNILFTRYTMTSAEDSIIPEFTDKVSSLQIEDHFRARETDIVNMSTGAKIIFRGLMASSGNQVAKLKSLHGVKTWVLDEAQELTDPNLFDAIDFSVRTREAPNQIILSFNPTDVHSWIYERFYKNVPEGFNGVIDDVRYISTTYLCNKQNLDQSLLRQAEKMRIADYEKYRNIWLGEWETLSEGIIYKDWKQISLSDFPRHLPCFYGVDWGYSNDPTAVVCCAYDIETKTIYLREVCYQKGLLAGHISRIIYEDMEAWGVSKEADIYCDPARPEHIGELRMNNLCAMPADNRNKEGRISYLQYFSVKYAGEHIKWESDRYSWKPDPKDRSRYLSIPQDGNDHLMDAINYACVTKLRYLGQTNILGEG